MPRIGTAFTVGASTEAKQDTEITSLQLIDELPAALSSIALDQIRVDIISGAVSGGDASAANQVIQITAEQAIQAAVEALTKQAASTPVDAQVFNNVLTTYTSSAIDCSGYRKFLIRMILAVANAPTDITISILFSSGGVTYEKYMNGPFGSLMYEDSAGAKTECIFGECLAPLMKIKVDATGTTASATFTLTCKLVLTR